MELTKHIGPEQVLLSVSAKDKWELLDIMVDAILRHPIFKRQPDEVRQSVKPAILEREKSMSTGMGQGYALPHARLKNFSSFVICIAVLKNEIEYETLDNEQVKIVCMVISPEDNPTMALKVMGALSGFLLDSTANYIFNNETDPERLYKYLEEKHINLDVSITARDIMRTVFPSVKLTSPLQQVTSTMFRNKVDSIAVVDEEGALRGEITCDLLFKRGIPDFFNQLASVSFIKDFDPFEKYFGEEAKSNAEQVMSKTPALSLIISTIYIYIRYFLIR